MLQSTLPIVQSFRCGCRATDLLDVHGTLRKSYLQLGARGSFLKGMGGPGAPHFYSFERAEQLLSQGPRIKTKT